MKQAKWLSVFAFVAGGAIFSVALQAQVGDPATLAKERIVSEIKVTKAAADHTDVVTAGDIVQLHKDGLMMCSSESSYADSNLYKDGALSANYQNRAKDAAKGWLKGKILGGGSVTDAANNGCKQRKFVAGEKFWVTDITLQNNALVISTLSDPYNDVRYFGEIKFPFQKGAVPTPDAMSKTVAEVLTVAPSDDKAQSDKAQNDKPAKGATPPPAAEAAAPMSDIPPPPPPADTPPPTIAVGQSKDQVTTAFGQPARIAKVGAKEIYYYKDMKVTFLNGKVSDIQ